MHSKVETAAEFKRVVVNNDYREYKAAPTDLRRAYHLALGLFHLRDWTFWQYRGEPNWPHRTVEHYQKHLQTRCQYFGYMRDLANAVKHAELDPKKKPSIQMIGLANAEVSFGGVQPDAFQSNAFQTRTMIISQTSATHRLEFGKAADCVMSMWNNLFAENRWK